MTDIDRLGFLFMASVAVRQHAGEHSYSLEECTTSFQPSLTEASGASRPFEDEARQIGERLAGGGFTAMTAALDAVETLHGLNAGEWLARRWDGIAVGDTEWVS